MISLDRKPDIYLTQVQFDKLKTRGKLEIGSTYHITDAKAVFTVNGKSGDVEITKEDVGLGNVDNTADTEKNVLSATKLFTARKINGVDFDGTEDITVVDDTAIHKTGNETKTGTLTLSGSGGLNIEVGNEVRAKLTYDTLSFSNAYDERNIVLRSSSSASQILSAERGELELIKYTSTGDLSTSSYSGIRLDTNKVLPQMYGYNINQQIPASQTNIDLGSTDYPFNNLYLKGKLNNLTLPDKEDTIATLSDLGGTNKTLSLSINGGEATTYDGSADVAFDVSLSTLGAAKDSEVVHTNSDSTISEHKLVFSKNGSSVSGGVTQPLTLTIDGSSISFKTSQQYPNVGGLDQSSDGSVTLSATKWLINTAGNSGLELRNNMVIPWNRSATSFDMDLGSSTFKFNNLYLKGKINDLTLPSTTGALATLSDVVTSYDNLSNRPIENVDLSDATVLAGVVANTYYRHIGDNNYFYTKGVIYYYNGTNFIKVGDSGGRTHVLIISAESSVIASNVRAAINAFKNNQVVICRVSDLAVAVLSSVVESDLSEDGDGSVIYYSLMFVVSVQGTPVKFTLELPASAADDEELPFEQSLFGGSGPKTKQVTTSAESFTGSGSLYTVTVIDSDIVETSFVKIYPTNTTTVSALSNLVSKCPTVFVGGFMFQLTSNAITELSLTYDISEVSE